MGLTERQNAASCPVLYSLRLPAVGWTLGPPWKRQNATSCPCACNHYGYWNQWVGQRLTERQRRLMPCACIIAVTEPVGWT
ncbi:hypothetical protein AVEN_179705-1 [Araneus ventricosus]|uniref:Uncharacterized protein n=1 Tax=Araneus ventricosus TaxID=182803 RepID=A0A4Y2LRN1_ARAVE|nr:hypothetical protein AVEN_179705-1 [Araneus ventricosus]